MDTIDRRIFGSYEIEIKYEYNEKRIQLARQLKMVHNINITNYVIDYDYMFKIQTKIREDIQYNFKQIKNTQPHNFTMFLMMITDLTNIKNFYELYELYKIDNWNKQNINISYDAPDYKDLNIEEGFNNINISRCCCGHLINIVSAYVITNGNTNSQIVVGKDCIRKCLTEDDWDKFKKMEPYKKYLKVSNKITKLKKLKKIEDDKIEKEMKERYLLQLKIQQEELEKQQELEKNYRKCIKCDVFNIAKDMSKYKTMCKSCYVKSVTLQTNNKCLINLKKI
jgi:hypothetical protein